MLGDIDQRHREIAGGVQDRQAKGADQHHVAGAGVAVLPKHDCPGQEANGQDHGNRGMNEPQPFEIAQASTPGMQFTADSRVEPLMLVVQAAERPHQRHVVDDVDHFAIDRCRFVGKIVVEWLAGGSQTEHGDHYGAGDHDQSRRHRQAHRSDQCDRSDGRDARRHHVPDEHVLHGKNGVRGCGDAAGQHSWQPIGKIVRRVPCQVTEDVAAQVTGHADEGEARGPARNPPQKVVGADQRDQQNECQPHPGAMRRSGGQSVDQKFNAILRPHRTGDRRHDGQNDDHVRKQSLAEIAQHEPEGTIRIS